MIFSDPRPELSADARHFYRQSWMVATPGNLSARLPDGTFWSTARCKSKGNLHLDDFVQVHPNRHLEFAADLKPSAETAIHQTLYNRFPEVQACYHVHSVAANLVSRFVEGNTLPLPTLEMLKGLGVREENPHCTLAIFVNHLN